MKAEVRPLKMNEKLNYLVNKYWQDVWERKRDGGLVAWCSGVSPDEILRAMDISVIYLEAYSNFCAVAGISTDLCQRGEALGYSPDLCSLIKNFIGVLQGTPAMEPEMLPFGGLPKPDIILVEPNCPGMTKMFEKFSHFFNAPLLFVEKCRWHDAHSKEEIAHCVKDGAEELREMITFLERFTGRRLDYDRLSQNLALAREGTRLWWDTLEMCQNVPAPMSVFDAFSHLYIFFLYKSSPVTVTHYQELKAELAERVAHKILPMGEEKYRLYWDNLPIPYKLADHIQKFASLGAVPVVASLPFFFGMPNLDPERPLESLFESMLINPANRAVKGRIKFITKLVEDYSLDGLIMQRSRTCQVVNIGGDDIMEALVEKTGLPAVVVEGDICDPRFYSDTEFSSKIDAFMEILAQRGPRRR